MLGLDTSVVLRLLTGLPSGEASSARRRLEQAVREGEDVVVTDLVLAECYHALQYHYEVPKAEARLKIHAMLRSNIVRAEPASAIRAFEREAGAGLVDRLIHERHRLAGATTITLDRRMAALEGAVRLPSR